MDYTRESYQDFSDSTLFAPGFMPRGGLIDDSSSQRKKRIVIIRHSTGKVKSVKKSVELRATFAELADTWHREAAHISSPSELAMHPAYQRIIGLGPRALPLIVEAMKREPDWWFWALRAITGVDPVPREARGNLQKMTQAWLDWWENDGKGKEVDC